MGLFEGLGSIRDMCNCQQMQGCERKSLLVGNDERRELSVSGQENPISLSLSSGIRPGKAGEKQGRGALGIGPPLPMRGPSLNNSWGVGRWHLALGGVAGVWALTGFALSLAFSQGAAVSWWASVHAFTLGAVVTAIMVYTQHFAGALTRMKQDPATAVRGVGIRISMVQIGLACLVLGRAGYEWSGLADFGAILVLVALTIHFGGILDSCLEGMGGQYSFLARFYVSAGGCAVGAIMLAIAAAHSAGDYDLLISAHARAMVWGFVFPIVLITVLTLLPTMKGQRVAPGVKRLSRTLLTVYFTSIGIAVGAVCIKAAPLAGNAHLDWLLAVAGVAEILAGSAGLALLVVASSPRRARLDDAGTKAAGASPPPAPAGWRACLAVSVGVVWLAVCLLADGLGVASAMTGELSPRDLFAALAPVVVGAGLLPMIVQVLGFLLPVVAGGGPDVIKHRRIAATRGLRTRLVITGCGALLTIVGKVPVGEHVPQIAVVSIGIALMAVSFLWAVAAVVRAFLPHHWWWCSGRPKQAPTS